MLFIKRYDLLKSNDTFKLQYKDEIIILKSKNWDDADAEANLIIKELREKNTDKNVCITYN